MREILIKTQLNRFDNFADFAGEFGLNSRDLVLTNEYIYEPFMKKLNLPCQFVFQEKFGAGEPTDTMMEAIYAAAPADSYDRVVMVGGGAILDIGKLLSLKRTGTPQQMQFRKTDIVGEKEMVAIPTTCGTGSEVTNISVLIVRDDNGNTTKLGLVDDQLIPQNVCLIPELLTTLPFGPFAASSIDALIHAVESYLSPERATPTSELFGREAMRLLLAGFKRISEQGPDARLDSLDIYLYAATYAGIAFLQAGCATVHAMSFPLGGTYKVPHGVANYALFGKVLEKYDAINPTGKLASMKVLMSEVLGCKPEDSLTELAAILNKMLPLQPLHEYGMTEEDIQTFADSVLANQQRLVVNSYVPLDRDLIVEIYKECF